MIVFFVISARYQSQPARGLGPFAHLPILRPSCVSNIILYVAQANYDQAIGLMTILFVGTATCACGYRRRLAVISQREDEHIQTQIDLIDVSGVQEKR